MSKRARAREGARGREPARRVGAADPTRLMRARGALVRQRSAALGERRSCVVSAQIPRVKQDDVAAGEAHFALVHTWQVGQSESTAHAVPTHSCACTLHDFDAQSASALHAGMFFCVFLSLAPVCRDAFVMYA
jgi:hypothetical protein